MKLMLKKAQQLIIRPLPEEPELWRTKNNTSWSTGFSGFTSFGVPRIKWKRTQNIRRKNNNSNSLKNHLTWSLDWNLQSLVPSKLLSRLPVRLNSWSKWGLQYRTPSKELKLPSCSNKMRNTLDQNTPRIMNPKSRTTLNDLFSQFQKSNQFQNATVDQDYMFTLRVRGQWWPRKQAWW